MKHRILYLSLTGLLLFSCKGQKKSARIEKQATQKPNVIVILTDDQGYKDVGFNGSTEIPTPNIDRIAKNGVVFTNGYVSYSVCGPSRAGLLTGRYQDRFGFSRNPLFAPKDSLQGLPLSEETIANALQKAGYRTMAIGKWHMGAHPSQRPLKRGFDEFFGFLTGGHWYFPEEWTLADLSEVKAHNQAYRTKLLKDDRRVEEKEYLTDALSREAVDFVSRNGENPFFLYLAYNAPHTPLQATEKYLDRFPNLEGKRKIYAAMVSAVDDGVGNLLDKLDELDITDNTMVFFLSDNGGPERHNASDNGVLREGKGSFYEGGIRVPFAVQWPKKFPKGKTYELPIISLDIFATALAQSGASSKKVLDGVDLTPYLTGKTKEAPHEQLFWRNFDQNDALVIRKGNIKLIRDKKGNTGLYDLSKDLGEARPIENNETYSKLLEQHTLWNSENKDAIFMGLRHNKAYNQLHPERFVNGEKY